MLFKTELFFGGKNCLKSLNQFGREVCLIRKCVLVNGYKRNFSEVGDVSVEVNHAARTTYLKGEEATVDERGGVVLTLRAESDEGVVRRRIRYPRSDT